MLTGGGIITLMEGGPDHLTVGVGEHFKSKFIDLIKNKDKPFKLELEGKVSIAGTEPGGILHLSLADQPFLLLTEFKEPRSRKQENTLRGLERFIATAIMDRKASDEEVDEIHEAIIDEIMPIKTNTYSGERHHKRTSDATVVEMARCIEHAINWLCTLDIPDWLVESAGKDMHALWDGWYRWRYKQELDPLYDDEMAMDWTKYCEHHQVCELCFQPDIPGDPLERAHIVSGGANIAAYEKPWNWLRIHHSHHVPVQHQHGWDAITKEFPHIIGKLNRARQMDSGMNKEAT